MAKVIAIANQKGGVGKTTTCVNLAYSLGLFNTKTLLVDFDPQGNATSGYGVSKNEATTIYDVIIGGADIRDAIVSTPYGDIVPSNKALAGAGVEIVDLDNREYRLKEALDSIRDDYDCIIIDCPPSLELLTLNALCAADSMIVPIQCEYYALEGLSDLLNTVTILNDRLNPNLRIEGMVMTMYDSRTQLSNQVVEEVKAHFPDLVYDVKIPRNVRLSEAPSHGMPALALDKHSKGGRAYRKLGKKLSNALKGVD